LINARETELGAQVERETEANSKLEKERDNDPDN